MSTRPVLPLERPVDATVTVPGSKSLTNRALVCAALADGPSHLRGVLFADDTEAMLAALRDLGVAVEIDRDAATATVEGVAGRVPRGPASLDVRLSGTTARFLAPLLALGDGDYDLDAAPPFRRRPMGPLFTSLRDLGVAIEELDTPGHLPARLHAAGGLRGGAVTVPADVSSQFLSGLLLAGPCTRDGLEVHVAGGLVSRPYVEMTVAVMRSFGARVDATAQRWSIAPTGYRGREQAIEPDASAASYFLAAAAITGGRILVPGLSRDALQGDVAFADVLARMGAEVRWTAEGIEVRGPGGGLRGVDVDMADISDTAQTLAAVAVFADGPTRVRGIGFIRAKETDRIGAVVHELRRLGIRADEHEDGFTVHPGAPTPGVVQTYDDHRMAMSFALLGLRAPGIEIADPGCVAKTFPDYFAVLEGLRR